MPQKRKVATRIHTAREFAPRDVRMIWPAISPMPRKATPTAPTAKPATFAPAIFASVSSSPDARNPSVVSAARTKFAMSPWITVATTGVVRPAGVAETSSARPCSSSMRVWRTARKVLMNAASMASHGKIRNTMSWPCSAPEGRPRKSRMTGFAITVTRSA